MIYTTNSIENINRQIRKTTKNKLSFESPDRLLDYLFMIIKELNKISKAWNGNHLSLKVSGTNLGCETDSYVRYNKNTIEVLSIEPSLLCWGWRVIDIDYTLKFNNIFSSLIAYLSNETYSHNFCRINAETKESCIIDGNLLTNHKQAENYGFVKLVTY